MTMRRDTRNLDPDERQFLEQHSFELNALRPAALRCPHPDMISAASMGVLLGEEAAGIRAHVTACRFCAALQEGLSETSEEDADPARLDKLWSRVELGRVSKASSLAGPVPLGIAAALLLTIGMGIFYAGLRRQPESQPPSAVETPLPPSFVASASAPQDGAISRLRYGY
jgi:hypothetical protein